MFSDLNDTDIQTYTQKHFVKIPFISSMYLKTNISNKNDFFTITILAVYNIFKNEKFEKLILVLAK